MDKLEWEVTRGAPQFAFEWTVRGMYFQRSQLFCHHSKIAPSDLAKYTMKVLCEL